MYLLYILHLLITLAMLMTRNGFKLKEMGNDTESLSMWAREQEVSKWISSNEFKKLELVA